jgi:3-oxoadipate enol-lactonase
LRRSLQHLPPTPPALPPGRVVNVAGRGEMFVREADGPNGGGPTILLMHGWTASADLNWFPLYQPLSRIGRVLAVDHRGHGRGIRTAERFTLEDCADDAAGLVRQLGLGPVIVVGYSMGGPISLLFWKRHPELVSGLVLEATALEWRASLWERFIWRFMSLMELGLRLGPSERLVAKFLRDEAKQRPEIIESRGWFEGEIRRGDPAAQAMPAGPCRPSMPVHSPAPSTSRPPSSSPPGTGWCGPRNNVHWPRPSPARRCSNWPATMTPHW